MSNYLHPDVYDNGLVVLTNATGTYMHICSTQPATYANVATYTLGNKASPTVGSPASRSPTGRKVTVSAITGTVTSAGTSVAWALVDATRLLATGPASGAVVMGPTWSMDAIDIGIPNPA